MDELIFESSGHGPWDSFVFGIGYWKWKCKSEKKSHFFLLCYFLSMRVLSLLFLIFFSLPCLCQAGDQDAFLDQELKEGGVVRDGASRSVSISPREGLGKIEYALTGAYRSRKSSEQIKGYYLALFSNQKGLQAFLYIEGDDEPRFSFRELNGDGWPDILVERGEETALETRVYLSKPLAKGVGYVSTIKKAPAPGKRPKP